MKLNSIVASVFILILTIYLPACSGSNDPDPNLTTDDQTPKAQRVFILDQNKGVSIVSGDILEGSYNYVGDNSGLEGNSEYSWFRGTPPVKISGADGLTYRLTDLDLGQVITFSVTPVSISGAKGNQISAIIVEGNNHPIATIDSFNITEDQLGIPINSLLLSNDNDPDQDIPVIFDFDMSNSIGRVTVDGTNNFQYDSNGQFQYLGHDIMSNDSFSYTVIDGRGGYDSANVSVTIKGVNDRPLPKNDATQVSVSAISKIIDVLVNDTDVDSTDVLIITDVDLITHSTVGTVNISGDGKSLIYFPTGFNLSAGETAIDKFIYEVDDQQGIVLNSMGSNIDVISKNVATVSVTVVGQ